MARTSTLIQRHALRELRKRYKIGSFLITASVNDNETLANRFIGFYWYY